MKKGMHVNRGLHLVVFALVTTLIFAGCDADPTSNLPNVLNQINVDNTALVHQAIMMQEQLYGKAQNYNLSAPEFAMQEVIRYWAYSVCGLQDPSASWATITSIVSSCTLVQPGNLQCVEFVTGAFGSLGSPLPASGNGNEFWGAYQNLPGWLEVSPNDISSGKEVPQAGDIVGFTNSNPDGHVGIVVATQEPQGGNDGYIIVASANQPGNVSADDLAMLGATQGDFYKLTWHSQDYLNQHSDAQMFEGYTGDVVQGFIRHIDYTNPNVAAARSSSKNDSPANGPSANGPPANGQKNHFAPYTESMGSNPDNLMADAQNTGASALTLAFIVSGNGCQPAWQDPRLAPAIKALQAAGKTVILSFGGAAGQELAQSCGSATDLENAYQSLIDTYGVSDLDFDIEGPAIDGSTAPASIDLRNQAIADLQAKNPTLQISYTLGVFPNGLPDNQLNLLRNAISHNVKINIVNIMAMDYGAAIADGTKMGQNAIDAATATEGQLKQLYPSATDAQLWGMIGITPMLGNNDVAGEVFTLDDAKQVLAFAQKQQIGELSFWEVIRDRPCTSEGGKCTGLNQQPYDFSHIFDNYT